MKLVAVARGQSELSMHVRDDMVNGHGTGQDGKLVAAFRGNSRTIAGPLINAQHVSA